jgi:hypothetical protein
MTSIRTTVEHKKILDFSQEKISKSFVKRTLKSTKFNCIERRVGVSALIFNHITVGMYSIQLILEARGGLKNFSAYIKDNPAPHQGFINIRKDSRFNNQYWSTLIQDCKLNVDNLVDIIMYCHRLDRLKTFL